MDQQIQSARAESPRDETIINFVTGMISTLRFTPSQNHPGDCKFIAATIVAQVRRWDSPEADEKQA